MAVFWDKVGDNFQLVHRLWNSPKYFSINLVTMPLKVSKSVRASSFWMSVDQCNQVFYTNSGEWRDHTLCSSVMERFNAEARLAQYDGANAYTCWLLTTHNTTTSQSYIKLVSNCLGIFCSKTILLLLMQLVYISY